jgi:hypothetical protein
MNMRPANARMAAPSVGATIDAAPSPSGAYGIDLYWLPLGAGGWFVRLNGRIYETLAARREHRAPFDLYHSALEVRVPEGRFVIENAWPIPDAHGESRGVVVEGPVGSPFLGRLRTFRYEIRRWRDGRIPDIAYAVSSPQGVSADPVRARRLLDLVPSVTALRWGRDELGIGDMWNSNSTVAWLLARTGLPVEEFRPPCGGRAPGWLAGLELDRRSGLARRGEPDWPNGRVLSASRGARRQWPRESEAPVRTKVLESARS